MNHRLRLCCALLASLAALACVADDVIPADPAPRWWKGNLHTHTLWSDGDDFPEMVAEWYRTRGYHFLALSDHNTLSQGQRWMPLRDVTKRGGELPFRKYLERFGPHWVETRGESEGGGPLEVRLKPLGEFRALVEERGKFVMIQGEEISDRLDKLPVHMNATNLLEVIKPRGGKTVTEVIENNVRAVNEQAARTGQEILPHLNHPNFGYGVSAEDVAHAVSERFFEVYNGHPGVNQPGDADHVGIDRLWDIANTIRLLKLNAPPLYGLGTDDSHHYHVTGPTRSAPGRGWVMVRARHLTPESLIRAIRAGDFYASSGVTLRDVRYSPDAGTVEIDIEPDGDAKYTTRFIGTPADHDLATTPAGPTTRRYSDDVGKVFATVEGTRATYKLTGKELYVRAVVTSDQPPESPVYPNQLRQAWTQPVGWEKRIATTRSNSTKTPN